MKCPVCGQAGGAVFFEAPSLPLFCNVTWETRNQALTAPRGRIALSLCSECDFVHNAAFDPSQMRYVATYDNSLEHSAHFRAYAEGLARRLVEQYNLREKDIVEIGCGRGHFLELLCEAGNNRGHGFDPSLTEDGPANADHRIDLSADTYDRRHADTPVDFLCCRHVLEHIARPREFLGELRTVLGSRRVDLFFEVPNANFIFAGKGAWDILYEHCGYFTERSLDRVFRDAGFFPRNVATAYDGQFLQIEASTTDPGDTNFTLPRDRPMQVEVRRFAALHGWRVSQWRRTVLQLAARRVRMAIWGAGSKGVIFLNMLGVSDACLPFAVDLNPAKQGRYIPGTGQKIISPPQLPAVRPDVVVIMNAVYRREIAAMAAKENITPEFLAA